MRDTNDVVTHPPAGRTVAGRPDIEPCFDDVYWCVVESLADALVSEYKARRGAEIVSTLSNPATETRESPRVTVTVPNRVKARCRPRQERRRRRCSARSGNQQSRPQYADRELYSGLADQAPLS
jgi:hypothetical protein